MNKNYIEILLFTNKIFAFIFITVGCQCNIVLSIGIIWTNRIIDTKLASNHHRFTSMIILDF